MRELVGLDLEFVQAKVHCEPKDTTINYLMLNICRRKLNLPCTFIRIFHYKIN
jgi:hypothetical protein